ncbi:MAG: sigma-54-dependent Fis family transcriptional regulator [Desulfobacteraceae bacterium]|nr:MAG: sigma-54-dependent Fis family transcriptional regulator [Desulfobacteraceae bacterium]
MTKLDILIAEDEPAQREMLSGFLAKQGHHVLTAANGEEALAKVKAHTLDLAIVDYKMPGLTGLDVLQKAKQINPGLDLLILTAFGTIDTAVAAMKAGAADYLSKPIDLEELLIVIDRIAGRRTLESENEILREQIREKEVSQDQIVHGSRQMAELINLAGRVAASNATVLIQGESGTGKELFARLIHRLSPRSAKPLIVVNCAALSENLIESELFGHERGAFTGATQKRVGRFEQADGGSLFLDEIGEISPAVQVKLLRLLQEGEFQRVGGNQTFKADVRLISATNQDLGSRIKEGAFREDLFYRLNVVPLKIPPLRERREDITPLVDHFVRRFAKENRKPIEGVSREAMDQLVKYDYPGNIRELENILERAVVIARGATLTAAELPFGGRLPDEEEETGAGEGSLRQALETLERRMVADAMKAAGGNQSRAAEMLGLSERMLRYKLKKHKLKS